MLKDAKNPDGWTMHYLHHHRKASPGFRWSLADWGPVAYMNTDTIAQAQAIATALGAKIDPRDIEAAKADSVPSFA